MVFAFGLGLANREPQEDKGKGAVCDRKGLLEKKIGVDQAPCPALMRQHHAGQPLHGVHAMLQGDGCPWLKHPRQTQHHCQLEANSWDYCATQILVHDHRPTSDIKDDTFTGSSTGGENIKKWDIFTGKELWRVDHGLSLNASILKNFFLILSTLRYEKKKSNFYTMMSHHHTDHKLLTTVMSFFAAMGC